MKVYEFLTLTQAEASLLCGAFTGHWFEADEHAGADKGTVILLTLEDAIRLDGAAQEWQVDGSLLKPRIAALTDEQIGALWDALKAFWQADEAHSTRERLSNVGLV